MDYLEEIKIPETLTDNQIEEMYELDPIKIAIEKYYKIQKLIGVSEKGGWYEYANSFGKEDITLCLGNTRSGKSAVIQTTIGAKLVGIK